MLSQLGDDSAGLRQPPHLCRYSFEQGVHGEKKLEDEVSLNFTAIDQVTKFAIVGAVLSITQHDNMSEKDVFLLKDLTVDKHTLSEIRNNFKQFED